MIGVPVTSVRLGPAEAMHGPSKRMTNANSRIDRMASGWQEKTRESIRRADHGVHCCSDNQRRLTVRSAETKPWLAC